MESRKLITILIIVFVLIALALLFVFLNKGVFAPNDSGIIVVENEATTKNSQGLEFLRLLQSLNGLRLNGDVLKDPAFMGLTDFSVELKDEPIGRKNPFLPLGSLE